MPALLLDIIGCVALCCGVLLYPLVIWTGIMVLRFVAEPIYEGGGSVTQSRTFHDVSDLHRSSDGAYGWSGILVDIQSSACSVLFIWINDTGAFLVGSTLGSTACSNVFRQRNLGKDFSGTFLQYNCGVAVLAVRYGLFGFGMVSDSCWFAIGFAVTVTVFGTWGTLWNRC